MLSIAVYTDSEEDIVQFKDIISDFLLEVKMMAKLSIFNDAHTFITTPNRFDIYIMDMDVKDDVIDLATQMMTIDEYGHFIFTGNDKNVAYRAAEINANYFIHKPELSTKLKQTLTKIKQRIQLDHIIIKASDGEHRLPVNKLNYINIVKRCLCYHLSDGAVFDSQSLRTSFEKAIDPLHHHKAFLFIAPSLLINLGEIEMVATDHLKFMNGDILYFPKTQYDIVRNAWLNYTRILDGFDFA